MLGGILQTLAAMWAIVGIEAAALAFILLIGGFVALLRK